MQEFIIILKLSSAEEVTSEQVKDYVKEQFDTENGTLINITVCAELKSE